MALPQGKPAVALQIGLIVCDPAESGLVEITLPCRACGCTRCGHADTAAETAYEFQDQSCDTEQAVSGAISLWVDKLTQTWGTVISKSDK